jgi:predicted RNase H-like nuclease
MLIALLWRTEPLDRCSMIGDLTTGYIVTPVSLEARLRLSLAASQRGVLLT